MFGLFSRWLSNGQAATTGASTSETTNPSTSTSTSTANCNNTENSTSVSAQSSSTHTDPNCSNSSSDICSGSFDIPSSDRTSITDSVPRSSNILEEIAEEAECVVVGGLPLTTASRKTNILEETHPRRPSSDKSSKAKTSIKSYKITMADDQHQNNAMVEGITTSTNAHNSTTATIVTATSNVENPSSTSSPTFTSQSFLLSNLVEQVIHVMTDPSSCINCPSVLCATVLIVISVTCILTLAYRKYKESNRRDNNTRDKKIEKVVEKGVQMLSPQVSVGTSSSCSPVAQTQFNGNWTFHVPCVVLFVLKRRNIYG